MQEVFNFSHDRRSANGMLLAMYGAPVDVFAYGVVLRKLLGRTRPPPRQGFLKSACFPLLYGLTKSSYAYEIIYCSPTVHSAWPAALSALRITVNGIECAVDTSRQIAGKLHYQPKDDSFLTAVEVPVPTAAAVALAAETLCTVEVWSDVPDAGGIVVSTVSLVTATNQ